MAVIHVLDKHTAELIAAGEVVERPASVVKELLENSIDAGATQVTVSIESGGVKLIEISDNGTGIDAEYIPTAFIRHATSKIEKPDDLNSIHTLGFRGEALASIASVARVELLTRTEVDEFATCYRIAGGEEQGREPAARAVGTTIRVQDLFYNTPARMKFLKKDSSEGTFVADNVGHVALSHPEVSVKFIREGKLQYVTPGDGQLRSAAYAVLGREFSRDLIEVHSEDGLYRVTGLITRPRAAAPAAVCSISTSMAAMCATVPSWRAWKWPLRVRPCRASSRAASCCWKCPPTLWTSMSTLQRSKPALPGKMTCSMSFTMRSSWRWHSPAPGNAASPLKQTKKRRLKKKTIYKAKIL